MLHQQLFAERNDQQLGLPDKLAGNRVEINYKKNMRNDMYCVYCLYNHLLAPSHYVCVCECVKQQVRTAIKCKFGLLFFFF